MYALSCHKKDYWLAYQLNKIFDIKLSKVDDLPYYHDKLNSLVEYSLFYFQSLDGQAAYYLLGNFNPRGKLFAAYKNSDYFLLIHGQNVGSQQQQSLGQLRQVKGVLGVFNADLGKIRDMDNFLSDLELHMIHVLKAGAE